MSLAPGVNVGPYLIIEQIGRGGMAAVYKAYEDSLARHVAIKVLPEFFAEEKEYRVRFQVEAVAVAKLRHLNIVSVFAYGEENGQPYIVSEFMDGGTLAERLEGVLPVDAVVALLEPIASALDYAHSQGVLHRDIKPSNIMMVGDQSTPVLTDFGLAKILESDTITLTGQVLGTPEYMAPELCAGEEAGPTADIYSLGVVAYQMLTGRVPFKGNTPGATIISQIHDSLPPPQEVNPNLPRPVAAVLAKVLAKVPHERYQSAGEFVSALATAATATPLEAA